MLGLSTFDAYAPGDDVPEADLEETPEATPQDPEAEALDGRQDD